MSDSLSIKDSATSAYLDSHIIAYDDDAALPSPPSFTPEQERKLYRKLDLRLMPILSLMYLLASMDGGMYAPVYGFVNLKCVIYLYRDFLKSTLACRKYWERQD